MLFSRLNSRRSYGSIIIGLLIFGSFVTVVNIGPVSGQENWWNSGWRYRKAVTIDHAKVTADLTNFPVLINITDADLASKAQTSGNDIAFVDFSGNQLNHEIELYDTGRLVAWVRVPSLSSTNDTKFYMYYGNAGASNQQNPTSVWDSNYVLVLHLKEKSGMQYDSTSNKNNGTPYASLNQSAVGKVDGADDFDGVDDYVRVPNNSSLQFDTGSFTAEAWIKPAAGIDNVRIVNNRGTGAGGSYKGWQLKIGILSGNWHFSDTAIDDASGHYLVYAGTSTYSYGAWHDVVMVYDAGNQLRLYVDGNLDGTLAVGTYGNITNNLPTAIGAAIAANGVEGTKAQFFKGPIDEVRLSNVARSANWISTSYKNQNDPSSFYSVGIEERVDLNRVTLNSPLGDTVTSWTVDFNFTPKFYQAIQNASLYTNETGSWQAVETIYSVTANQSNIITHTFPHTDPYLLEEGTYIWNVEVWNASNSVFASSNSTVTIDVPPRYENVSSSTTTPIEGSAVTLYGEAYDGNGLDTAWLWTNETGGTGKNYTEMQEAWTGNGTVSTLATTGAMYQRGILYKGILYDHDGSGALEMRNWTTGNLIYSDVYTSGPSNTAPAMDYSNEQIVYAASCNGVVVAFNTTSKTEKWKRTLSWDTSLNKINGAILGLCEDYLYVLLTNFTIFKLDKTTGNTVSTFVLDYSPPTHGSQLMALDESNKRIYAGGYSEFQCINITDMTEIWHANLPTGAGDGSSGDNRGGPIVINDTSYCIQLNLVDYGTYNFDFDGNLNWNVTIPGGVRGESAYSPKTKYVYIVDYYSYGGTPTNHLYAFNITTGKLIWKIAAPRNDHFFRTMTIVGDYGLFHTNNYLFPDPTDYLYVINMTDGSYVGEIPYTAGTGERCVCYPIIVSAGKAVTGGSNCLLQFDLGEGEYADYKYLYGNNKYNYIDERALSHYGKAKSLQPVYHDSPIDMGGAAKTWAWSNFTWSNSSITFGTTVQWRIYYNDTYGHVVGTTIKSFTVQERPPALWWNGVWPYRKPIIIDHTKVAGGCGSSTLANFPVLLDITDSDLASYAQSDGSDIAFADILGNKLDHEIEFYSSGHLVAWVRVPSLSSTEDTMLLMYYGNPTAPNQENTTGVWDSHYVMVQHLKENSGTHYDSTSNNNDGTYNGVSQGVAGKIDGADDFDGVNDYIDVGTGASLNVFGPGQDFSITLWVKRDDLANLDSFFSSGSSYLNGIFFGCSSGNLDDIRFMSISSTVDVESTVNCIGNYEWHLVGVSADRNGNLVLYVDGVAVKTADISTHFGENWNRVDDTYKIGTDRSETNPMDGKIDEVRVSDIVRSACWISTSYNNQRDPSSFYTVGSQEMQEAKMHVDPPLIEKTRDDVGSTFNVNVTIEKVMNLWGFDFNLTWDNTLITLSNVEFNTTLDSIWGNGNWYLAYNETGTGYFELAAVSTSTGFTSTGPTPLATLTFHVEDSLGGETALHFAMAKLGNSQAQNIPVETTDGIFRMSPKPPDIEIIPPHITCRMLGENLEVEVNLTHVVDVHDFHFEIMYNTTLLDYVDVAWGELGPGTITVDDVVGLIGGHILPADPNAVVNGNPWMLNMTFHASYPHIWKAGATNDLQDRIWFHWAQLTYLTGSPLTYQETGPLREIDVFNSQYTFSPIQGDIGNDGKVDVTDLRTVAAYYDVKQGDPLWPAASAYDLYGDGIIDIFDLVVVGSNFGYTYSP